MSLLTSLVSFWNLDEASGTRVDSVVASGNDLTDNNTVTGAAGPGSHNASAFVIANSEYLSRASNASLQMGDFDFTFTAWVYLSITGITGQVIIGKEIDTPANSRDYTLISGSGTPTFYTSATAGNQRVDCASTFASANTWYFVACWNDSVARRLSISLNNGTATVSAAYTGSPSTSTSSPFNIGRRSYPANLDYLGGRLAMIGIWKRLLTAPELTTLYNGGSGLNYAEIVAASAGPTSMPPLPLFAQQPHLMH